MGQTPLPSLPDAETKVRDLLPVADSMWVATDRGAYRVEGTQSQRLPDIDLDVVDLAEIDGAVWVVAPDRAYRIFGDDIQVFRSESTTYPLKSVFAISGRIGAITQRVPKSFAFATGPIVELFSQAEVVE